MAAGYKDFTAGAVLTAADLEDYCGNQAVMRFASAAARDAALTTVKTEGMCAYLLDVNTITVYTGAAWSTIGPVHGALTSWTPTITQGVNVTFTNTQSRYTRTGRWISGYFNLAVTSSGTATNLVAITLPVAASGGSGNFFLGPGKIFDASAGFEYPDATLVLTSTTVAVYQRLFGGAAASYLGQTGFSAALAAGDSVAGTFAYEAAADA